MTRLAIIVGVAAACVALVVATPPSPSRQVMQARARWMAGDRVNAQAIAAGALERLARRVMSSPMDPDRHMELAEVLALTGHRQEALNEARRAIQLDPAPATPRPRWAGGSLLETMVVVALEAGATEKALEVLEVLLARASHAGGRSLGDDPRFASLRADPRFISLLATY